MTTENQNFDEFYGYAFEDLVLGMSAAYGHTVTDADILLFAGVSGDTNPNCTSTTSWPVHRCSGGRIAHGMLSASYISTVFGTKLPAPAAFTFRRPSSSRPRQGRRYGHCPRDGQGTHAREAQGQSSTPCFVGGKVVLEGEADIMVPARD